MTRMPITDLKQRADPRRADLHGCGVFGLVSIGHVPLSAP